MLRHSGYSSVEATKRDELDGSGGDRPRKFPAAAARARAGATSAAERSSSPGGTRARMGHLGSRVAGPLMPPVTPRSRAEPPPVGIQVDEASAMTAVPDQAAQPPP